MSKYYPPTYNSNKFHCPYCQVYANMNWGNTFHNTSNQHIPLKGLRVSYCNHCYGYSFWYNESLLVPDASLAPYPHDDLPNEIKDDYNEARSIVDISPRGAAALLRLSLQKLMKELGEPGKDINTDIGSLVKKGLPEEVQQALDIVRVIGNEAVHPGALDLKDDQETAINLFELINFIVEDRITKKKKITALFNKLPDGKKRGIVQRDGVQTP